MRWHGVRHRNNRMQFDCSKDEGTETSGGVEEEEGVDAKKSRIKTFEGATSYLLPIRLKLVDALSSRERAPLSS